MENRNYIQSILITLLIFSLAAILSMLSGSTITGLQTFSCGTENIETTAYGETHSRIQTGGVQARDNCLPSACSPGTYAATYADEIYKDSGGTTTKFAYYTFCIKDGTGGELQQCTTEVNSESNACSPSACSEGLRDIGTVSDLYNFFNGNWYNRVYRFCVAGSGILGGSISKSEQVGSFPTGSCLSGVDAGTYKEIHFKEGETYRTYKICLSYASPATTSSTTTTSLTTTSSSTTTLPSTSTTIPSSTTTTNNETNASSTSSTSTTIPSSTAISPTTTIPEEITSSTELSTTTTIEIPDRIQTENLIADAENKVYSPTTSQNLTALDHAKLLLTEARGLAAQGDYELAKQKAVEALALAESSQKKPSILETDYFILILGGLALIIIFGIILSFGFFVGKEREEHEKKLKKK